MNTAFVGSWLDRLEKRLFEYGLCVSPLEVVWRDAATNVAGVGPGARRAGIRVKEYGPSFDELLALALVGLGLRTRP